MAAVPPSKFVRILWIYIQYVILNLFKQKNNSCNLVQEKIIYWLYYIVRNKSKRTRSKFLIISSLPLLKHASRYKFLSRELSLFISHDLEIWSRVCVRGKRKYVYGAARLMSGQWEIANKHFIIVSKALANFSPRL